MMMLMMMIVMQHERVPVVEVDGAQTAGRLGRRGGAAAAEVGQVGCVEAGDGGVLVLAKMRSRRGAVILPALRRGGALGSGRNTIAGSRDGEAGGRRRSR